MSFVHLHVHTEYSLLDGACRIRDLPGIVKGMGQTACAITDHGVVQAYPEAFDTVKKLKKEGKNIKLIPGMAPGILDYVAEHAHAVVIESFGVGGVPYYDNDEFTEKIGHLLRNHVKVIFTTQVSHEGSDMELYRVGFRIKKKYELLEAYTMTTEAVVAKVEWALANSADDEEFRKLFLTPVGNDRL